MNGTLQESLNQTSDSTGNSLKSRTGGLLESIEAKLNYLQNCKGHVQKLRVENEVLENELQNKVGENRQKLNSEIGRIGLEMKGHFSIQKAKNNKLQQKLTQLKGEKTAIHEHLIALKSKISALERVVGKDK
mmetsp:Transcript_8052/g.11889  ORF Transcript_8052/g.11889 Transcript_8052/m.11889 type:complete len:132 (-) Transcript_8052:29-424(-)